ncbi:hypothetical protein OSB04_009578 [Centaurea solstitialis]|uniref:DUF4283 domain-containing protein n=1 Tax=Centaurea solstitialis TaxID=347529 RepID=A0AA38T7J6_9ASTR|nr:hypothetical protein OSB04_009578 [Centaurea solstitialis]
MTLDIYSNKSYGLSDVILNDQGYFFFKFNSEQGLNFVFENGPWLFNGMPIFIQKWQPGLCFDKSEPKKIPLWVNIYGLPLDVWDYEIISYIASVVGEPISVDRYSDTLMRFVKLKPACLARPHTVAELKIDKPLPSVSCIGESSKAKVNDDGFKFPKRKPKPKPKIAPLKVGGQKPKVAFNTGIKINQRYVHKLTQPSIDPLDKGKAKLVDDTSSKVLKIETEKMPSPIKVDDFVENRGVGLEPVIVNSWSKQKLDYFIGRWEKVYGKELDGKLRGFTLSERVVIPNDVGDESESDDEVSSDQGGFMDDMAKETPYGTWLRQK